jgi:acetyltransferase
MTHPAAVAQALVDVARDTDKPVLASWMGGDAVEEARTLLNQAGLPTYDYPDEAARSWQFMWQRQERLRWLAETNRVACLERPTLNAAKELVARQRVAGRVLLTEAEAKQVLAAAGIPVLETVSAVSSDEAVQAAVRLGFPVVLKLQSRLITHKTDVGGVQLDLVDEGAVRAAWDRIQGAVPGEAFDGVSVQRMVKDRGLELICGCVQDAQFGPVLMFGAGGVMVEVMQDRVLLLPPLSRMLAMDRMRRTRIHRALLGTRHLPAVDLDALAEVLVKLGDLVLAVPEILELDINPLAATVAGVLALDARIVIRA